jgi:hypothetical protein
MRFTNESPFDARFISIRLAEREDALGMVLVKATYALAADGSCALSDDPFPLSAERIETPFGVFHGEVTPPHDGVDVCVLATLRRSRPVREATVTLRLGALSSTLRIIGDRKWQRGARALVPTPPAPFVEMPISYRRAYGGAATEEDSQGLYPDNPVGIGYYATEEAALGNALPNIEPADHPGSTRWDRPVPVAGWGPYPSSWALRMKEALELEGDKLKRVRRSIFNNAHPSLVATDVRQGDRLQLDGVLDEPFECRIPLDTLHVDAIVGEQKLTAAPRIDGVSLWLDERKLVVKHRAVFSYPVRPHEIRKAVLVCQRGDHASRGRV